MAVAAQANPHGMFVGVGALGGRRDDAVDKVLIDGVQDATQVTVAVGLAPQLRVQCGPTREVEVERPRGLCCACSVQLRKQHCGEQQQAARAR